MLLRDGILSVRDALGEMQPSFWSDAQIIKDLNRSARKMCSAAQYINSTYQFPNGLSAGVQEYELPDDCETVTGASLYSGTTFQLRPIGKQQSVQVGGFVSSIPGRFYVRRGSLQFSGQVPGGERQVTNIPQRGQVRLIIGYYPIPLSNYPAWVDYLAYHPQMKNTLDECFVPVDFEDAWYAYAISKGKEKEGSPDEAAYWLKLHEEGKAEFVLWNQTNGQEVAPPRYGEGDQNILNTPASTVIVVDQNPGVY